jgi:hypothetical protein
VRADLVDDADVRMVEGGGGLRFLLETLQGLWGLGEGFGEELELTNRPRLSFLVLYTTPMPPSFSFSRTR